MFGTTPKVGLSSLPLPESIINKLSTEEELVAALDEVKSGQKENIPLIHDEPDDLSGDDRDIRDAMFPCSVCEAPSQSVICELCKKSQMIITIASVHVMGL